jgi:HlyD family secretion protein
MVRAVVGTAAAIGLIVAVAFMRPQGSTELAKNAAELDKRWQAVAPGRVVPLSGEIKITPVVIALVDEVLVKTNDRVFAGEPLIRLKDDELRARLAAAEAQVDLRQRARDEQRGSAKTADRRKTADALSEAETEVFDARAKVDAAAIAWRRRGGSDAELRAARAALSRAQENFRTRAATLRDVEAEGTLPTQLEAQLNAARAERSVARAAVDKMMIRAPIAGTVLQVNVKAGETAAPSSPQPLIVMGDLSALRVRAEVDERDVGNIKIGQPVVVRAAAFPGREFAGKVASIAPIVAAASGVARGSRNPTDVDVVEVMVDLTDPGPLASGMQVDAYFR